MILSNGESVIVSAFIFVHVSRKHGKIKKEPVLTRLPHSLGPGMAFSLICQLANQLQIFIRFSFRFFPIMGWFKKYVAVRGQEGILPLS